MKYELSASYDSRKSFYGKANVIEENGIIQLKSYSTIVAEIENGKVKVYGTYSNTTLRHIKEFLKQHGFKADSSSQIMNDYYPSKEDQEQQTKKEEEKFNSMFNSIKAVCAVGGLVCKDEKSKNDWTKRMIEAGLSNKGLSFPEDWNTLDEAEKSRRLEGALNTI